MVELSGAMNLLSLPEYSDVDRAKDILSVMEKGDALYEMLKGREDVEFTIKIGHENELSSMKDCSVVTATYELGEGMRGTIGIIGPKRMDYDKVIGTLKTITHQLDDLYKKKESGLWAAGFFLFSHMRQNMHSRNPGFCAILDTENL